MLVQKMHLWILQDSATVCHTMCQCVFAFCSTACALFLRLEPHQGAHNCMRAKVHTYLDPHMHTCVYMYICICNILCSSPLVGPTFSHFGPQMETEKHLRLSFCFFLPSDFLTHTMSKNCLPYTQNEIL